MITVSGKVWDVDVRYSHTGTAIAQANISVYQGKKDGKSQYGNIKVKAFKDLGESFGNEIQRGDNIIVVGRLVQESWETEGKKHYAHVIIADEIGKSIRTFGQPKADAAAAFGGRKVFPPEEEIPF